MIAALMSVLGGGATGVLGSLMTNVLGIFMKREERKQKKDDNAHELAVIAANTTAMVAEADAGIMIAQEKSRGIIEGKAMDALMASHKSEEKNLFQKDYMRPLLGSENKFVQFMGTSLCILFGLVDAWRKGTRPFLTSYLVGATTWITWLSYSMLKANGLDAIPPELAMELFFKIVLTILYLTVSSVTWWFVDRKVGKMLDKILSK